MCVCTVNAFSCIFRNFNKTSWKFSKNLLQLLWKIIDFLYYKWTVAFLSFDFCRETVLKGLMLNKIDFRLKNFLCMINVFRRNLVCKSYILFQIFPLKFFSSLYKIFPPFIKAKKLSIRYKFYCRCEWKIYYNFPKVEKRVRKMHSIKLNSIEFMLIFLHEKDDWFRGRRWQSLILDLWTLNFDFFSSNYGKSWVKDEKMLHSA